MRILTLQVILILQLSAFYARHITLLFQIRF